MKSAASVLALSALLTLTPALAGDDHHPKHGGQVQETTSFDLELVAKNKELVLYIADHKGKNVDTQGATGTATVLTGKDKETVKLTADGKGVLKGTGNFTIGADTKIILSVTASGKTEQARFTPMQKAKADDHKGHKH